ncbi:hypothetical protein HYG77_37890 (plasmid) [Rhodococcus sp. ZPP]|uniref:Rv1733c family protein n=1 Tax=Rhodococcus sp. ZPP TaxID=2749906 RepID=UPI001AD889A7|nr:hypothetical protein [Rhodococcus sp. ZPP]QTJ71203.1 hypothetical protein HYG77_37890 [Rhodococcus sp. ZPP]
MRIWRLGPWSRNPLMRPCDRVESTLVLIVAVVVLLLVPVAVAYGIATHTRLDAQARADRATAQQVPAVLVEDARPGRGDLPTGTPRTSDHARARWSLQTIAHTGEVPAPPDARAGETVNVWLNSSGEPVAAPATNTETAAAAVSTAVVIWAAGASGAAVLLCGVHAATTRHRMTQWDAEWNELDKPPGWHVS